MKKHLMQKICFILTTAVLGSISAMARSGLEPIFLARCTVQNGIDMSDASASTFDLFGFSGANDFVRTHIDGKEIKVPVKTTMPSWMSYQSTFALQGQQMKIVFSNHLSPSLGKLFIDQGPAQPIACELSKRETQSPPANESVDSCLKECGRSCFEAPVFCGQW